MALPLCVEARVPYLSILLVAVQKSPSSPPSSPPVPVKRSVFQRVCAALGLTVDRVRTPAEKSVAFTIAVISLSAKMAKADGVASRIERETFDRIFRAPPQEAANVQRLFNLAAQDVAGFEAYAQQIATLLGDDATLKQDVFESLFHIAASDGVLHPAEEAYLHTVATLFGLTPTAYRVVRAHFVDDPDDPYQVLDLQPGVSNDVLKARFRQLVRDNHPDLVIARGVPKEFVDAATRKLAAINAAFDQIVQERGI
jgi:DnaJ like chaperone protein